MAIPTQTFQYNKVTVQTVQCVLYVYFPWDKYKKSHRNTDFIYYFLQFILIPNKSCKFMSDNLMNSKLNILLSGPCGASLFRVCRFIGFIDVTDDCDVLWVGFYQQISDSMN